MQVQEMKVTAIKPYENNPRKNDPAVDAVAASIKEFGWQQPIVVDRDMVIIAGHTRYKAAKKLKLKVVPVLVAEGLAEEQVKAYRLADNKSGELATWDESMLLEELAQICDIDMSAFGFDALDSAFEEEGKTDEDAIPEIEEDEPPVSIAGEIYQLGRHRLMCGDSTSAEDVARLMDGDVADMIFTDPPYNVAIGDKNKALQGFAKAGRITENIANDKFDSDEECGEKLWLPAFTNMKTVADDSCAIYVTMPQGGTHMMMMMMMMAEAGWQVKHELMWVKDSPTFSMGRLDYDYKHEPICYGWNRRHQFYGKGAQNKSVWEFPKPKKCDLHPTMKPVALVENAIMNSSKADDIVLDLFGGSGTTMIACENTGRVARLMELDPKYCDVIRRRWAEYTHGEGCNWAALTPVL